MTAWCADSSSGSSVNSRVEVSSVERRRPLERLRTLPPGQALERDDVDVDRVPIEHDHVTVGADQLGGGGGERVTEGEERLSEAVPRLLPRDIRPEEGRQRVARLRLV